MTKVLTFVGTRPEVIRLSRVIPRLSAALDHVLVHTGQNWDPALRDVFFDELRLARPDHDLQVDTSSLGHVLGGVLVAAERVIDAERPDAVLVLGDTNSAIAALMARRMKVPVYHMEAGNRCFDLNVPEETNRRLIDHISDFNLVYTEHARRNLLAEGLPTRRIMHTGSPMREILEHYRSDIEASTVLSRLGLTPGGYFVVSAHREETVDDPARLDQLLACLVAVREHWGLPVLFSTHPRTRKRLAQRGALTGGGPDGYRWLDPGVDPAALEGIILHQPFGFFDFVRLQTQARCTLSDSGTVSEEAAILGFAAVTLREAIERPEALEVGSVIMTGLDPIGLIEAIEVTVAQVARDGVPCPDDYRITDTSRRVVDTILSTVRRHHQWDGIRVPASLRPSAPAPLARASQ